MGLLLFRTIDIFLYPTFLYIPFTLHLLICIFFFFLREEERGGGSAGEEERES